MIKNISILGSTGSIGTQALDVIRQNTDKYAVVAMTCGRNIDLFTEQLKEFHPVLAVTERKEDAEKLAKIFPDIMFESGMEGIITAASEAPCDLVVNALMGMRGLEPTYRAILNGRDVALANKETLVAGGELIMKAVKESVYTGRDVSCKVCKKDATCEGRKHIEGLTECFDFDPFEEFEHGKRRVRLLPIDSEHSAIFQCLEGNGGAYCVCDKDESFRPIKKLLLTCSGGPFRGKALKDLEGVTLEQALNHPKWSMGKKITIDSATLMNKGLEVIEAKWLFNVDPKDIEVLVHPQSIVHSAVEYQDNSILAQLGRPDMRIPISLALGYPDRLPTLEDELNMFEEGRNLTFEKPDLETFKCLKLAFWAIEKGGSYPVVMNAANEVLVEQFLAGKIAFLDIPNTIERVLNEHEPVFNLSLEEIIEIDQKTREMLNF